MWTAESTPKGVLEQLISLSGRCRLIPILGNHDEMMLHSRGSRSDFQFWLNCGGTTALDSYGSSGQISLVPTEHFCFLESCVTFHETASHIFLHANYKPKLPLERLDDHTLRWLSLRDYMPSELHCSQKVAILGHSPQSEVLDRGYFKCIDTGCCNGGWLTALDVDSGDVWQAAESGHRRT